MLGAQFRPYRVMAGLVMGQEVELAGWSFTNDAGVTGHGHRFPLVRLP